jgi:hypothetical protein
MVSAHDPKTGRRAVLKSPNGFYGPYPPLWLDELRVPALHQTKNTKYCDAVEYALIACDVAAALSLYA